MTFRAVILMSLIVTILIQPGAANAEKLFKAITEEQPPWASDTLKDQGWAWVLVKKAMENQGYTVPKLEFVAWKRAVEDSKKGKFDGLFLAFWTRERTEWFEYSLPITHTNVGFFRHKKRADIVFSGNLDSLKQYSIGVGRGYAITPAFDSAEYLDKHIQRDWKQGMKMLQKERLDLVVGNKETMIHIMSDLAKAERFRGIDTDLVFIQPSLQVNALYMAISKKAPNYKEKLRDLNAGLTALIHSGEYARLKKAYGGI